MSTNLNSKFTFQQTNLINATKNANGNNIAIICNGNRYLFVRFEQSCHSYSNDENLQKFIGMSNFAKEIADKRIKKIEYLKLSMV